LEQDQSFAVLTWICYPCVGLEFYSKLEQNVSRLLARVNGVVRVQEEERQQLTQSTNNKAAQARYEYPEFIADFRVGPRDLVHMIDKH
jgi:hypothetical protein